MKLPIFFWLFVITHRINFDNTYLQIFKINAGYLLHDAKCGTSFVIMPATPASAIHFKVDCISDYWRRFLEGDIFSSLVTYIRINLYFKCFLMSPFQIQIKWLKYFLNFFFIIPLSGSSFTPWGRTVRNYVLCPDSVWSCFRYKLSSKLLHFIPLILSK